MCMDVKNLKNKKVTVLGAARSGLAAAKLLRNVGALPFVSDISTRDQKAEQAEQLQEWSIPFEFGRHSQRVFDADFMVLSPGIAVKSDIVRRFLQQRIPVYSEIEVASWFCKAPIIAVTGSNGKTTTTTLIGEMLRTIYPDAIVAGNIGQPFSSFVLNSHADSWAVVEVSSFQLETIERFHPRQAVILNFAPNHLDRYDSYQDYLRAKWRITENLSVDDLLIFNAVDAELLNWVDKLNVKKIGFHINGSPQEAAWFDGKSLYLYGTKLMNVDEMILRGKHNYMNAMAAALAAGNAKVPVEAIRRTLKTFAGVEHRLEFVTEKEGVKYINDSKATTVESLSFALQSFREPVVLIAGGKDKGSDFSRLNPLIKEHVKELILIGDAADKMSKAWQGLKPIHRPQSFEEAIHTAKDAARPGEVVLLSPACASFDMFKDFEDRGRQFKELVNRL